MSEGSAASRVTSSALLTIGWLAVRFIRAVTMLSRSVAAIAFVPAIPLVTCDTIAFKTSGCFVFKEVLAASMLASCKVNTWRRPPSADLGPGYGLATGYALALDAARADLR